MTLAPKPARTLAPKPAGTYAGLYDLHIAPYLGQLKLAALTPEVIARWQAERLRAGAGRSSIHKTLTLLGASLQRAVESGRIARNPARLVREASRPARREVRPLAPATVEALRQASGARDATRISVLAYAGLRPQEALALRWEDVRERTILVDIRQLAQARLRPHRRRPASRAPRRTRCATARFAAAARLALDDYVARQLWHDARLRLSTYGHVSDEFDGVPRVAAKDAIPSARGTRCVRGVSESAVAVGGADRRGA